MYPKYIFEFILKIQLLSTGWYRKIYKKNMMFTYLDSCLHICNLQVGLDQYLKVLIHLEAFSLLNIQNLLGPALLGQTN